MGQEQDDGQNYFWENRGKRRKEKKKELDALLAKMSTQKNGVRPGKKRGKKGEGGEGRTLPPHPTTSHPKQIAMPAPHEGKRGSREKKKKKKVRPLFTHSSKE